MKVFLILSPVQKHSEHAGDWQPEPQLPLVWLRKNSEVKCVGFSWGREGGLREGVKNVDGIHLHIIHFEEWSTKKKEKIPRQLLKKKSDWDLPEMHWLDFVEVEHLPLWEDCFELAQHEMEIDGTADGAWEKLVKLPPKSRPRLGLLSYWLKTWKSRAKAVGTYLHGISLFPYHF